MITVFELIDLFVTPENQEVSIYDCHSAICSEVFRGFKKDIPETLGQQNVTSIDNIESWKITINIDTES